MPWWKGDDNWDDCEQFNNLSADALALFTRAQSRMGRLMSDGVLTERDLDVLDQSRTPEERTRAPWRALMHELAGRHLFVVERVHWLDPGWLDRNPSREEVEAKRAQDAIRQRLRYAEGKSAGPELKAAAPGLRQEAEVARQRVNLAIERRRAAAAINRRLSSSLQTETTLHAENERRPPSAPSRPVPSPNEDEDGETYAQTMASNLQLLQSPIPFIRRAAERALGEHVPAGSPVASPSLGGAPTRARCHL